MKKTLFHFVRYAIILFPIIFLIIVMAHTNYYTNRNRIIATTYPTKQYQPKEKLPLNQIQKLIDKKEGEITAHKVTERHKWQYNINEISSGNKEWVNLALNILPYAPIQLQKSLEQALIYALQTKPKNVLQSLASTNATLKNTNMICTANNLSKNDKPHLVGILQSMHNPSFIYQQQSCLRTLLSTIKDKQPNIS